LSRQLKEVYDETDYSFRFNDSGPGKYQIKRARTSGSSLDWITIGTYTADTLTGEISFNFKLGRGEGALLHIVPQTLSPSHAITLNYKKAMWDVNGRKIAVDPFGRVHICYTDSAGGKFSVWYARSDDGGTTWQKQRVVNNALCPAIAVDTFGIPWVTYMTYPDMHKVCVWSEGFYDTLVSSCDLLSNAPCIALDFEQGVGMIFYSSRATTYSMALELPSLKPPSHWYRPPKGNFSRAWPLSCSFSEEGDAVATGSGSFLGQHEGELYRRIEKHPSTLYEMKKGFSSGWHGNPSTGRQGSRVWAAYYHDTTNTIRYKKASRSSDGDYIFPGGRGDSIAYIPPGYKGEAVQIADGLPFVVWEQSNTAGTWRKIYYSYLKTGDGTSWSPPTRVDSSGSSIIQRYPHVDHDYDNKKIYVIWTQYGGGNGTSIGGGVIPYDSLGWDSVWVIKPNGPRPRPSPPPPPYSYLYMPWYWLGETINVEWDMKEQYACSTRIYARYDFPNDDWEYLGDTIGNVTTWPWKTKKRGSKCRVKVEVWYPGNKNPYDISDENFRIVDCRIKPFIWPPMEEGEEPSNILSAGGLKTIQWQASSFNGLDTTQLQATVNGGGSFSFVADSCVYDSTLTDTVISGSDTLYCYEYNGTTYWTTPATPTSYGFLRLMAVDTTSDTIYSYDFYPFCIPPPGGFKYNTYSNQGIMSLNDDADKIGLVYTAQDPDDATRLSVIYMESDEGLDFSAPDTVGLGCWPSFSEGACFWRSAHDPTVYHPDALFYAYQLNDTFSTPYPLSAIPLYADSGGFAPVGFTSVNDTVHAIIRTKIATHEGAPPREVAYYSLVTLYSKFPEASPGMVCVMDTLQYTTSTNAANYNIGDYAPSVVKRDSVVYCAYNDAFDCCFAAITQQPPSARVLSHL